MKTWQVRITGKQQSALDVDLLLAAVIALGRQWQDERKPSPAANPGPGQLSAPAIQDASTPEPGMPASRQEAS